MDSTQKYAISNIDRFGVGTCITSKTQTAGVGKPGSTWVSPPGNLYASYVLEDPGLESHLLVQAAAVAAIRVLPDKCQIKWLNDLVLNDKKIGGIICDRIKSSNRIVVGIGINLQTSSVSSSILDETGIFLDPIKIAIQYGDSLIITLGELHTVTREFNTKLAYKDKLVNFIGNGKVQSGIIKGITEMGELEIYTELGLETYKACTLLPLRSV